MKIRVTVNKTAPLGELFRRSEHGTSTHGEDVAKCSDSCEQAYVRSPEAHPNGFESVASISSRLNPKQHLVLQNGNQRPLSEDFHLLSHRLCELRQQRSLRTVLVTSAIPKEGKTMVAINLAITLARKSAPVLLIDADMREPDVHRVLGVDALPGLAEVLQEERTLPEVVKYVDQLQLYYLPAGRAFINPSELLQQDRVHKLIQHGGSVFDWIIIDSPPLVPFADAHCLSTLTDGVLWVVRSGLTPHEDLEQGLAALNGTHIVGFVLNADNDSRRKTYYSNSSSKVTRANTSTRAAGASH